MTDSTCPECGAHLESISDCFYGHHSALDNFEAIRDYLERFDVLCDYPPLLDDYEDKTVADLPGEPRDGPFIQQSLVCTETRCSSDSCGYFRRTYSPPVTADGEELPPASQREASDCPPSLDDLVDDIDEEIEAKADALLDAIGE